jgi:hypothetical protein
MSTVWQQIGVRGILEIPGCGVRVEALPIFRTNGALARAVPHGRNSAGFKPLMACSSWSHQAWRAVHQHVNQDDYFVCRAVKFPRVSLGRSAGAGGAVRLVPQHRRAGPSRIHVPRGVVHAYKNVGHVGGLVVTVPACCSKAKAGAILWTKSVMS